MKHKVIAGLTTKDEDWIVEKTLKALNRFCDKIVVYDDGSTDDTEEICRSFNRVEWHVRPPHDALQREEAKQRLELINILKNYDLDYALLLDADEIPTPNIISFVENIDNSFNLYKVRMINLWEDEENYRTDSYNTVFGTRVNWDPFTENSWFKFPLLKFNKNYDYEYNLAVQKGGCSRYHPSPHNVPGDTCDAGFHIIHYGKIAPDFLNGDRLKFYSAIEAKDGKGSYEQRLRWHAEHNRLDTLKVVPTKKEWFWDD
jgi:glycosyltransferase involved in cell wall biosynthesis